jgi:membrane-bound lytic murein transglycosylase MltF
MYVDLKVSSAREISDLLRQLQQLEDELAMARVRHDDAVANQAELARQVAELERRLVVRASNALGRNPLTGRAVRAVGILRKDWKAL